MFLISFLALIAALTIHTYKKESWGLSFNVLYYVCWFIFGFALAFGVVEVFFL